MNSWKASPSIATPCHGKGNGALSYIFEFACALFWQFLYSWRIYFRRGFDVIQGCNPPDDIFLVALFFRLFGVKYIFDHHDANPELYLSKYGKKDFLYKIQVLLERLTYRSCEMNNISTMIKIMEYMALGKPIVQFDLKEGRTSAGAASLYADPGNPVQDFAEKILWLLDHPVDRARMGGQGRIRVERELAWKYSVKHLLAGYGRALSS